MERGRLRVVRDDCIESDRLGLSGKVFMSFRLAVLPMKYPTVHAITAIPKSNASVTFQSLLITFLRKCVRGQAILLARDNGWGQG